MQLLWKNGRKWFRIAVRVRLLWKEVRNFLTCLLNNWYLLPGFTWYINSPCQYGESQRSELHLDIFNKSEIIQNHFLIFLDTFPDILLTSWQLFHLKYQIEVLKYIHSVWGKNLWFVEKTELFCTIWKFPYNFCHKRKTVLIKMSSKSGKLTKIYIFAFFTYFYS